MPTPRIRTLVTTLLLSLPFLGAGLCGGESVCEDDRTNCKSNTSSFQYLESCDLTGDLQVEVGHGEGSYAPLTPDQMPPLHEGSQGGHHTFLAFRVLNADLTRYDALKISLRVDAGSECASDESSASCKVLGDRDLVLGGTTAPKLRVTDAGVVEEYGLLVFMDPRGSETPARVIARVEDPCRRTGEAIHTLK